MMEKNKVFKWTIANAFGLGIAFLVYLQVAMILEHGFDTKNYWQWMPPQQNFMSYIAILISALVGGSIFGWTQSRAIKTHKIKSFSWIFATSFGFGLTILIDWPLLYSGDLGRIPGPVEPLIFTVGGCFFSGVIQYFYLKKQNINARKWLVMLIIGLIASIIVAALFFMYIGDLIGLSWPMETFLSGFIIAGVASLISGKALLSVLPKH